MTTAPEAMLPIQRAVYGRLTGDGALMGWVVIERVTERSTYLDGNGIGRVVDIDIAVRRSSGPSNGSYFAVFSGLFT